MKTKEEKQLQMEKAEKFLSFMQENNIKSFTDLKSVMGDMIKMFIDTALEAEMDEHLGYEKWDQKSRSVSDNYRKGTSKKKVNTEFGQVEIAVPRDENGTFEPKLIPKYKRRLENLENIVISLYSKGLSTQEVTDTIKDLYSCDISKDTISRITNRVMDEIKNWQERPLDKCYPVVMIDGMRFRVKQDYTYVEKSIYIVIGYNMEGMRQLLGFWIFESESAKQWQNIFNELKTRGVEDIILACSDNLKGVSEAWEAVYPNIRIQKCVVHQIRNSMKLVASADSKDFCADMKAIYNATNLDKAHTALESFSEKWSKKYPSAVKSWKNNFDELTTFFDFPLPIRKLIYTTNIIENLNRNVRKITKSKSGFITDNALVKIVYLRLKEITKKWGTCRIQNWDQIFKELRAMFPEIIKKYENNLEDCSSGA